MWKGQIEEAVRLQDEFLDALRDIGDLQLLVPGLGISAVIQHASGNAEEAVSLLDECYSVTDGKSPIYRCFILADAVRVLVGLDSLEKARAWVENTRPVAWRGALSSTASKAALAEAKGEYEEALSHYQEAAAGWERFGHVLEQAMAHYGASRCMTALGRADAGEEQLVKSKELFVSLGAVPMINEINGSSDEAAAL